MKSRVILTLFAGALLGATAALSPLGFAERHTASAASPEARSLPWEHARLLAEVLERVQVDFVEDVDEAELIEGAIRGLIAELDPHSAFLDAEQYREIRISTTGSYSGVGLEVNHEDGRVVVVAPMADTPAAMAGIQPGDILIAIDGDSLDGLSLDDTVNRMRGAPGSLVQLDMLREGEAKPLRFDLRRTNIAVASVDAELLEDGLGYLRISQFSVTTSRDVVRALADLVQRNEGPLDGLLLDLRNNPGGVLDAAVEVADAFIESGVIVTADGRVADARFSMSAHAGDYLEGAPIVVLVNAGSASASEIVAGALKDHERATIVGTRTYGKGSVQTVMPLSNGRAIKLTTSLYFTPSGESIHERGIEPDIVVTPEQRLAAQEAEAAPSDEQLPEWYEDTILRHGVVHLRDLRRQNRSVIATATTP
jgi:carboxyl-terminal processing protease